GASCRFARTRPKRSASCGCGACAIRPSSTSRSETRAPRPRNRVGAQARPRRAGAGGGREMTEPLPTIVVTSGEPAGIGPDLCAMLATHDLDARIAVLGDADLLAARARMLGLAVEISIVRDAADAPPHRRGALAVVPVPARAVPVPGELDLANAGYVLELLEGGCDACVSGSADALVTAPVQKSVITKAGMPFSGHTEFLAERTGAPLPVM